MARPREFHVGDVVDRAVTVFSQRGPSVGVQELTDSLGLSRSSLYAAFGSREGLWLRALEAYRSQGNAAMTAVLDDLDQPPLVRLRRFLLDIVEQVDNDPGRLNCLVVDAACAAGAPGGPSGCDGATRTVVLSQLDLLEQTFTGLMHAARARGELPASLDPAASAALIVATLQGVRVLAAVDDRARMRAALLALADQIAPTPPSTAAAPTD